MHDDVVDLVVRWRGRAVAVERLPTIGRARVQAGPFLVELAHGTLRVDGAPIAFPALVERDQLSLALNVDTRAPVARDAVDLDPVLIRAVAAGLGAVAVLFALVVATAVNRDREIAYVFGGERDRTLGGSAPTPATVVSYTSGQAPSSASARTRAVAPEGMFARIERVDADGTEALLDAVAALAERERASMAALRELISSATAVDGAVFYEDPVRPEPRIESAGFGGRGHGIAGGARGVDLSGIGRLGTRGYAVDDVDLGLTRPKPEAPPLGYAVEGERERDCPDDDALDAALHRLKPELHACYDRAGDVHGDLFVVGARWSVLPDGRFVGAHAIELEGIDPDDVDRYAVFTRCIERTLARGRIEAGCPGTIEVRYPLFFAPSGGS